LAKQKLEQKKSLVPLKSFKNAQKYITILSKTNIKKRPIELPQEKTFNPKKTMGILKKMENP
jgi:hypothetical protein